MTVPRRPLAAVVLLSTVLGAFTAASAAPRPKQQTTLRINSGGGAVTDEQGRSWVADTYATGGRTWDSGKSIASPTPGVDRTERVGDLRYAVPVTSGSYVLRLHLTELYYTAAGIRQFDIVAEGQTVARSLDILAVRVPLQTLVLDVPVTVRDGRLDLALTPVRDGASITGMEILPVADAGPTPSAVPAGAPTAGTSSSPSPVASASPAASPAVTVAPSPSASSPVSSTAPAASPSPTSSVPSSSASPVPTGGVPSTSARGSFVERPCTRTYGLEGMQVGGGGDPVANGDRFRAVLAATQPGDCLTVAPGTYRLAGVVEFRTPNITLKGLGATREDVWFEHTTETRASFKVLAGGVHLYNFTHRVLGTARSSLAQFGEGNIWVEGGHDGFRMQDVLAWGSRDAAVFLYGVHHWELNRVESRDSMSDAYHVSNGSSYGEFYDSVSTHSGDDGIGIVGYGPEGAGTPHHITVVRHHVAGQTWGRGIGIIHSNNISIYGPTLIEDTAGAGIIMARENAYGTGSVRAVRVYGELRFRRANSAAAIDHGAIHINNPDTGGVIEDILITGPVLMVDTGLNRPGGVSYQVRAHGAGRITAQIADARFYGTGPTTRLSLDLAAGSSLTTPGWTSATPYAGIEPAWYGG